MIGRQIAFRTNRSRFQAILSFHSVDNAPYPHFWHKWVCVQLSAYSWVESTCVHIVEMHDDFGLVRPIFTLSTRLQFTLCSSIVNLSYVYAIILLCAIFDIVAVIIAAFCFFSSLLAILLLYLSSSYTVCFRFFSAFYSKTQWLNACYSRRQDESHHSDLCFPFIFSFALYLCFYLHLHLFCNTQT